MSWLVGVTPVPGSPLSGTSVGSHGTPSQPLSPHTVPCLHSLAHKWHWTPVCWINEWKNEWTVYSPVWGWVPWSEAAFWKVKEYQDSSKQTHTIPEFFPEQTAAQQGCNYRHAHTHVHTLFKKIHRMYLTLTFFFLIGNLFTILSTVSLKCHFSERWLLPGEIYFQIESQHVHAEKRLFWISKLEGIQRREREVIRICKGWFRRKNYEAKICMGELNSRY